MQVNKVYEGDCLDVMKGLPDNCIDTIITDPPYGLSFMGKDWDHGLPGVAYWREALRVGKPGAYLMAFGGTRTHHRLACAIEDAGWEIRDCVTYLNDGSQAEAALMASLDDEQLAAYLELHYPNGQCHWVYGSGFPKSLDIGKSLDKAAGAEREVVGRKKGDRYKYSFNSDFNFESKSSRLGSGDAATITAPATPLAKKFDGYGTALKPAFEPIIYAQKPIDTNYATNAERWGLAGLDIDGSRVSISKQENVSPYKSSQVFSIPDDVYVCMRKFYHDSCEHILSVSCSDSIVYTIQLHDVDDQGDKSLSLSLCEPCSSRHFPNEGMYEQNLSSTQDYQSDCLIYSHLCDELSRLLLKDVSGIQTLRNDVLKCIHPSLNWDDLGEVSRDNLYQLSIVHLSNCHSVFSFLSQLYSLLKSTSNYTTQYSIPQHITNNKNNIYGKGAGDGEWHKPSLGRYPANIIHSGEPGVEAEFAKAGVRKSGGEAGMRNHFKPGIGIAGLGPKNYPKETSRPPDTGSASRFFATCPPDLPRFIYQSKASPSERGAANNHPTVKPLALIRELVKLTRPPDGGVVLDLFAGSGTTALACLSEGRDYILIEKEPDYCEIIKRRIAEYTGQEIAPKEVEVKGETVKQMPLW